MVAIVTFSVSQSVRSLMEITPPRLMQSMKLFFITLGLLFVVTFEPHDSAKGTIYA